MRLGATIPNFKADTTEGPIKFYEWQGKSWVVLFSHPSDFTPVCTSELCRIIIDQPEFTKRNVKCIAHSVDELQTHNEWISDIKAFCSTISRIDKFPYPIIADPHRDLAVLFGMLDDSQRRDPTMAQTVRALFIISPDRKVRLSMFYPISTGRNVDEIIRAIDSLQLADKLKVIATPANWTPGGKIMILPEVPDEEAQKMFPKGYDKITMPSGVNYVRTTDKY